MAFYYDDQMNDDNCTVRLYGGGPSYGGDPIAKALFTENFEFEIGNSWTNFEGGSAIEGFFNQIKPLAGYVNNISSIFTKMREGGAFSGGKSKISRLMNDAGNWMAKNADKANDYLNKSLVVQGTRFIYFSGTNIDMGNLMMKYTIMYDPVFNQTVQDQLQDLMPYVIGDFKTMGGGDGLLSLIGWQDPPGGFKADYKNVDTQLTGTLKLEFGNMFFIDNLVCKSANIVMSRSRVKDTEDTPLFADVTLTFQLGGYVTKNKLLEYTKIPNSGIKF